MAENGNAWAINLDNEWNSAQLRQLAGAHMLPSGSLSSITGKRPGTGLEVSVNGSNQPVVQAGVGQVAGPANGDGTYAVCIPAAVTGTAIPLAGGGLKRHDRMVVRVRDADVGAFATALREVSVERIVGAETAGTPSPPSEPLGCLTVGLIEVTSTTRVVLAHSVPRYAALGGIVPVASSTARDALDEYDGLMVYREDTDVFEGRAAGAWVPLAVETDSDWVTVPATINWSTTARARKVNGIVYVQCVYTRTGANAVGTVYSFGPVAVGSRPAAVVWEPGRVSSPLATCFAGLQTDGVIQTDAMTVNTGATFRINFTFPAEG